MLSIVFLFKDELCMPLLKWERNTDCRKGDTHPDYGKGKKKLLVTIFCIKISYSW